MRSGRGVDKLPGDTHSASCFSDAAFEDVTHPEFAANVLNVYSATFIGKARVTGDNEEATKAGQRRDYFLDDTIREILLLAVAAQVIEWEDSDRGFAG